MPANGTRYIVVYDISNNKERGKLDKILAKFGFRVQLSVYECMLTRRDLTDLVDMVNRLDLKTGFMRMYRIAPNAKIVQMGIREESDPDGEVAFII